MINKNKEEIEKILKGCGEELCNNCQDRLQATIKTSIQWCEDEIDNCDDEYSDIRQLKLDFQRENYEVLDFIQDFIEVREDKINEKLQQLQSHLKWLKQQEKLL